MDNALVFFDDDGTGYQVDVIEHLGVFWLVPAWFEYPDEKLRMPARIISLMTLRHQNVPNTLHPRFLVNDPISRDVFEGRIPPERATGYIVIERPDVSRPLRSALN